MRNSKVLLKDLPFGGLNKGVVVTFMNHEFGINRGETWYSGLTSGSHNGITIFEMAEEDVIKSIWNDEKWFSPVELSPIRYSRGNKSITLSFDTPMDLEDIEAITKGIQKTLSENFKSTVEKMGWNDARIDIVF